MKNFLTPTNIKHKNENFVRFDFGFVVFLWNFPPAYVFGTRGNAGTYIEQHNSTFLERGTT